jgi:PAS domain S-box-containing protein
MTQAEFDPATQLRRERLWQRSALAAAVLVGIWALAGLGATLSGAPWAEPPAVGLALLAGTAGILCLLPDRDRGPVRRWLGMAAAILLILLGVAAFFGASPLPGLPAVWPRFTGFCFLVLGLSLAGKSRFPATAVTGDMMVAFVGYALVLDYLFQTPAVHPATGVTGPMRLTTAAAVFILAGAWMCAWPNRRPVSFFLEASSAGAVLRRLLPVTLLYPILLVVLTAARSGGHSVAARIAEAVVIYGTVVFGVVLLWVLAHQLDRRDAMHRAATADLRAGERRYRQLFDNNPQPMWVFAAGSLRFLDVNESALQAFGYSREEFLRFTVLDVRPAADHARVKAEVATGEPAKGLLWRYYTRSGALLEAEVFSHPVDWGGTAAFMSFLHDVTAGRRAEQRMREQDEQIRTLLESTSEGIYTMDRDGNCLWCNPAAVSLLGLQAAAELEGRNVHDLCHHSHRDGSPYPAAECVIRDAIHQGRSLRLDEETFWRADGTPFPGDAHVNPLRRDGAVIGGVVTISDASERQSLRAQFQQAQKMEAVGRLAAGVAHDFNNLLTVINGYAELLLARPEIYSRHAPTETKLAGILKAGERAAALTRQLLAFSRQQVLEPRLLDLNQLLKETDPLLRRVIGEDLELTTACEPDLGTVKADPGQLSQILMNLVVNARDAMPSGGRLTIETANVILDQTYCATHPEVTPGAYVMLAVTDTGTGMDAATLNRLFEPFFTTKPVGRGTGLGLATVHGIVKENGGSIAAYSELGHGTAMKVYLPRHGAPADAAGVATEVAARGSETILLVEDEDAVRRVVSEILTTQGYQVVAASRPTQAVELARRQRPDLVITDVVMPEMDGRALVTQLTTLHPGLAVLFASGYPDRAIAQHRELDPGVAFIQKPFTSAVLAAKVRRVLDDAPAAFGAHAR